MEQTTLEQFRSYVTETVMKAPQIYVQIKTLGGTIFFGGGWLGKFGKAEMRIGHEIVREPSFMN